MQLNLPLRVAQLGRLAVQFGAAFALAIGLAGMLIFGAMRQELGAHVYASLLHERARLLPPGQSQSTQALLPRILALESQRIIRDKGHQLFAPDGHLLLGKLEMASPPEGFSAVRFRDGGEKWREAYALSQRLPDGGRLVLLEHSEVEEELGKILPVAALWVVIAACITGVVAALAFGALIAKRLSRSLATADAIARGDLTRRIPSEGLDGIFAQQVTSLNRMLDRMEDMVRSQRQFSSHLAHDLRTPLTRLRAMLQQHLSQSGPDERRLLEKAERECHSVIAIFDSLLRLSEIEAGRRPTAQVQVPLADFLLDLAETMEPVIADAGSCLMVGELAPLWVSGDLGMLQQMLVNLLENIALHTPAGTRATLAVVQDGAEAVITVADNGPGIAPGERNRVVRPFESGAKAANARPNGGNGLGLAIAEAVMRFHKGTLELADNRPGLAVRLRFPLGA